MGLSATIESGTVIASDWINLDIITDAELDALGATYREATPFPHLVMDNLFSTPLLREVAEAFDNVTSPWRHFHGALQIKRATASGANLPNFVQEYFNFIYSGPFLRFLSRITCIDDLIPDPALYGGGMHEVDTGGRFEVHLDFRKHPRTGLINRLVLITYLNEEWAPEDGGALELWSLNPPRCDKTILPTVGRTVIMEQSGRAAHGHPEPVGKGRQRRSVIAYFYTTELATDTKSDRLATTYIPHDGYSARQRIELYLRRITPQFVVDRLRAIAKAAARRG
jgi:hypothetical protein